ncbi:MAG: hypothetical protein ACOX08_10640 [Methanobacterium sp.]|jgi:hypothetical protein
MIQGLKVKNGVVQNITFSTADLDHQKMEEPHRRKPKPNIIKRVDEPKIVKNPLRP